MTAQIFGASLTLYPKKAREIPFPSPFSEFMPVYKCTKTALIDKHRSWKKQTVRGEFPCTTLLYNYNSLLYTFLLNISLFPYFPHQLVNRRTRAHFRRNGFPFPYTLLIFLLRYLKCLFFIPCPENLFIHFRI